MSAEWQTCYKCSTQVNVIAMSEEVKDNFELEGHLNAFFSPLSNVNELSIEIVKFQLEALKS